MDVLKRSEFCGGSKVNKDGVIGLLDIGVGTIFTGIVDTYPKPFVWMRTHVGIVRLSDNGIYGTGYHISTEENWDVRDYEALNATLVIDD